MERRHATRTLVVLFTVATVLSVGVAASASRSASRAAMAPAPEGLPTTAPPLTTTTTAGPAPTTTAPTTTAPTVRPGTTSTVVPPRAPAGTETQTRALQHRLAALGYDVGAADGAAGVRLAHALMAFRKVEGLARTGRPGPEVDRALAQASRPGPLVPGGAPTRVEVDLRRQVLFLWVDGSLARILPVSTGSGQRYCVQGRCEVAVTPTGTFPVGRKVAGTDVGPLGPLYYPMYFSHGVAIHGEPSVPAYPASHGCVRIPMESAAALFAQVPAGTPVYVLSA